MNEKQNEFKVSYFNKEQIGHPLHKEFGRFFSVERSDADHPKDGSHLVIAHCKATNASAVLNPDNFSRILHSGTGILLLDPDADAMKTVRTEIGLSMDHIPYVFFIYKESKTHFRMFEIRNNDSSATLLSTTLNDGPDVDNSTTTKENIVLRSNPDAPGFLSRFVSEMLDYLLSEQAKKGMETSPPLTSARNPGTNEGNSEIPADIKQWSFVVSSSNVFWFGPDPGHAQWYTGNVDYHVSLFLNSASGEQYQYIHIRINSRSDPGKLLYDDSWHRGKFQDKVTSSMSIDNPRVSLDQSSPKTVSRKKTVTDSVDITIGYEISKGPKQTGSYKWSHAETNDIQDWQVVENTEGGKASWIYAQESPYDALADKFTDGFSFDAWQWWDGISKVKDIPHLSRYTLQTATQAVWRTLEVLNEEVECVAKFSSRLVILDGGGTTIGRLFGQQPKVIRHENPIVTKLKIDLSKIGHQVE